MLQEEDRLLLPVRRFTIAPRRLSTFYASKLHNYPFRYSQTITQKPIA